MITELTPERQAIISEGRAKWLAAGLSTQPADFDRAESAITRLYERIGKKKPHFVRLSSPFAAEIYINLITKTWPKVLEGGQLGDQLRGQLGGQLGGQLRDQLGGQLWDQLGGQLWGQLRGQLRDQLRGQLEENFEGTTLSYMGTWFAGQWDSYLWGWLETGRKLGVVYKPDVDAALDDHCEISQSINWFYPFNDFCIMTDRPRVISRDLENRPHNETGKALEYSDGSGFSAWHGTRVPDHWVTDKATVDPSEIIKHENVEVRAAGAALIGWPRMLSVLKMKVIDDSGSDDIGQLIELTLPGLDKPGRFLKAHCPRNGTICEGVPYVSDIDNLPVQTALHAQAWRIGDALSEYEHPLVRT